MVFSDFFDTMIMNVVSKEIGNDYQFYVRPLTIEDIHNFDLQYTDCDYKFDKSIIYSRAFVLYDFSEGKYYILHCNVLHSATVAVHVYYTDNEWKSIARTFICTSGNVC